MSDRSVTIVGATGCAGRAYVRAFRAAGYHVRGTLRRGGDPAPLVALGAEPVEVSLDSADGAAAALKGVAAVVVALLGRGPDPAGDEAASTRATLAGAVAAGAGHLVYTSVHLADAATGVAHFDVKRELEAAVAATGLPYTVLRPTTFMEGLDMPWLRDAALETGELASPIAPDVPISYVAAADVAALAVRAVDDPRLEKVTLEVGGPRAWTYRELLPVLTEVSGRSLRYRQLDLAPVATYQPHVAAMIELFNRRGYSTDPPEVAEQLGIRMTDLTTFLLGSGWTAAQPPSSEVPW